MAATRSALGGKPSSAAAVGSLGLMIPWGVVGLAIVVGLDPEAGSGRLLVGLGTEELLEELVAVGGAPASEGSAPSGSGPVSGGTLVSPGAVGCDVDLRGSASCRMNPGSKMPSPLGAQGRPLTVWTSSWL